MPHERVYLKEPITLPNEDDDGRPAGIDVQWHPGQETVGLMAGLLDESDESLKTPGTRKDGYMVWMDRGSINRLIQVLRHARNKAFGADE